MTLKRAILAVMDRDALKAAVDALEIDGVDRRSRAEMAARLSRARRATPEFLLGLLREWQVKQVCERLGVPSVGRRGALVRRLLDRHNAGVRPRGRSSRGTHRPRPTRVTRRESTGMSENRSPSEEAAEAPVRLPEPPPGMFRITKTELVWPGKYDEHGNLREPPRVNVPFQVIERVNESRATREAKKGTLFETYRGDEGETFEEGWRNKLIWGDNLLVMSSLLEKFAGKIGLIYIDPPFATGADFSFKTQIGESDHELCKEQSVIEEKAYRDTWGRGAISFLDMILPRLRVIRELLADSGSIFVHMDWHLNHLVRALLDEVFGADCFVNEIIVNRGRRKSLQSQFATIAALGSEHDTVFLYSKSPGAQFSHVRSATRAKGAQWQSFWRGNVERPTMQYELLGFKPSSGQFLWSRKRAEQAVKNYEAFLKSGEKEGYNRISLMAG